MHSFFLSLDKYLKNNYIFFLLLLIFFILIEEPSLRLFSSEIHYLGETLRKYNYINHEHSSYIVYGSPLDYRYLFDWLTIFYYEITNQNIILTSNLGRITCSLLFCYAFFHFSKTLEIDLVSTLIIICVFLLMNQQIIGGNKLFANGFQSTAISNALNILSFSFFLRNKNYASILLLGLSTNFHFLNGGFWFLIIFLGYFFTTFKIRKSIILFSIYFIICLPILILLFNKINIGNDLSSEVGQILAFRSKHHILPFYSFEYFIWWIPGIVMLILYLFIISSISENEKLSKKIKLIITLVITQLLLCLIISIFDKNYIIANFTPFRTSPILLLLIIYYFMFKLIKHDIGFKIRVAILVPLIINITYPALGRIVFENVDVLMGNSSDYKSELYDFIEQETKDDDIIFTVYDKNIVDLELLLNKATFFNWKKIPSSSEAIIEWWRRYQLLEKIDDQMCKTELNYINYFIVEYNDKKLDNCGVIVFNNQEYKLIKNK